MNSTKGNVILGLAALICLVLIGLKLFRPVPVTPPVQQPATASRGSHAVRLPPPRMPVTQSESPETNEASNVVALLNRVYGTNGIPKLTRGQVESYLRENHRSAESLLVASRVTGEKSLLREAMETYPNDPHVAFDAYFLNGPYDHTKAASEERRKWLNVLQQSDAENALGDYLSARDHFKSGQTALALQELQAASGKTAFRDYSLDFLQASEEAYRSAGYPEVAAKWVAGSDLLLPTLSDLKQLGQNVVDLANQYRRAGDATSAQAMLEMGLALRDRFSGPDQFPLINTLVGMAVEKNLLGTMDPNSAYGSAGQTVQSRLDALSQQRTDIKNLVRQADAILPTMSAQDLISFRERVERFGEATAMRWAIDKYGAH